MNYRHFEFEGGSRGGSVGISITSQFPLGFRLVGREGLKEKETEMDRKSVRQLCYFEKLPNFEPMGWWTRCTAPKANAEGRGIRSGGCARLRGACWVVYIGSREVLKHRCGFGLGKHYVLAVSKPQTSPHSTAPRSVEGRRCRCRSLD